MRTLRAILIGILLWILIFVEVSILMIGLNITGVVYYIIHYILLIIFTITCASMYYKHKDQLNGFILGFFFILIGTVLDLIITRMFTPLAEFYSNIYLWIGFLIVIITAGIYELGRRK